MTRNETATWSTLLSIGLLATVALIAYIDRISRGLDLHGSLAIVLVPVFILLGVAGCTLPFVSHWRAKSIDAVTLVIAVIPAAIFAITTVVSLARAFR